ncbi:hypothetical protein SAMN05428959_104160 [Duganella sp. CF517]|uniref:hypothetical protein n=1 Tax=Duganella sp. CF517 TaxID=1881038 RepID=UPI0008D71FA9|nr:hypothetical protein [Duganella sp. CF517]SEO00922.1 hypothetical protein SAMN05428959_104160 [Duganella sp. CF517]
MKPSIFLAAATLSIAGWAGAAAPAAPVAAAAPDAARVQAAHDLLASMQAEKMLRMTAGMSKFPSPAQRELTMAKVEKVTPQTVYTRLSQPVARLVSTETALEMTRYYQSSYGQRLLKETYNGGPRMYAADPTPTPAEKAEQKKPAFVKASKEFKAAEPAIRHEVFVLLTEINKGK